MDQKFITKRTQEQQDYLIDLIRKLDSETISFDRYMELKTSALHQLKVLGDMISESPQNLMDEVVEWADKTFPSVSVESCVAHLVRESKEARDAIYSRLDHPDDDHVKEEIADCFILIIQTAARFGMSFDNLMHVSRQKFEINKKRVWGDPDSEGIQSHLE